MLLVNLSNFERSSNCVIYDPRARHYYSVIDLSKLSRKMHSNILYQSKKCMIIFLPDKGRNILRLQIRLSRPRPHTPSDLV